MQQRESQFRFCPRDGSRLEMTRIDGRDRPTCPRCGFADFMHVQIGANTIVERDGRVLLVRLNYGPRDGRWALPGGLVEADESVEEAAIRETGQQWQWHRVRVHVERAALPGRSPSRAVGRLDRHPRSPFRSSRPLSPTRATPSTPPSRKCIRSAAAICRS